MRDKYLYDSKEGCCEFFFHSQGKDCLVKEFCSGTTSTIPASTATPSTSPTRKESCESRPWHPLTNFEECSNSEDHPESWNLPEMKGQYMFDTQEECCEAFFFVQGKECEVEDACTNTMGTMKLPTYPPTPAPTVEATSRSTACNSRPWHPTTDFQSCSNK